MTKEDAEKPGCNKTKVFVWFLRIIKVISILALLVAAVSYCLQMKASVTSELNEFDKAFSCMSSLGYVILCLIMVITELELEIVITRVPVLKFWVVRGLALCWLGVQTIHSAEQLASAISATVSKGETEKFTLASQVCGWTLIGVACLYVLMTITCMHRIFGLDSLNDVDATLTIHHHHHEEGSRAAESSSSSTGNKNKSSSSGTKEDADIISNMAIALNITSREARSRFAGSGGAEEARRMRTEALRASSAKFDEADDYSSKKKQADYAAPLIVSTSGDGPPAAYTPAAGDDDDDDNPRARRQREQDALDAAYYANQQ